MFMSAWTVSYTHLDVYKRQILVMAVMFGMVIGFFKVMEILNLKPQQILSIFHNMNTLLLALAGIVIFLVLMCISYHTSVRIMQKKEL